MELLTLREEPLRIKVKGEGLRKTHFYNNQEIDMTEKQAFLNPRFPYRGDFTPDKLVFNANLQEFAHKVGFISTLETGGNLTPEDAYQQLRSLWHQLRESAQNLGISINPAENSSH